MTCIKNLRNTDQLFSLQVPRQVPVHMKNNIDVFIYFWSNKFKKSIIKQKKNQEVGDLTTQNISNKRECK